MQKIFFTFLLTIWCLGTFAQNINKIEYFIDADPGYGAGVDVPITAGSPVTANFDVALPNASVSDGFHYLSIRARDVNNAWSVVGIRPFYKETLPAGGGIPNIVAMEYFIDADPGYGLGTAVAVTAGSPVTQNFTVALPSVSDGFHYLSIRAKDANNKWSVVAIRPFYNETLSTGGGIPNIVAMEYFIDADPGYGLGTAVTVTAGSPVTQNFTVALPSVSDGFHYLSIRAKDANNKWSVVAVRPFYKETLPAVGGIPNIVAMEYFIDADPGYGLGTAVNIIEGTQITQIFIPNLGTLSDGEHTISVRAKDVNNKWGIVNIKTITALNNIVATGSNPVAIDSSIPSNSIPSGTEVYTIPSALFEVIVPFGASVVNIKITNFPVGALSITINGVEYGPPLGAGAKVAANNLTPFPEAGVLTSTNANGDPITSIIVKPLNPNNASIIKVNYSAVSNQGVVSTPPATLTINFPCGNNCADMYTIKSGLWNDPTVWSCCHVPTNSDAIIVKKMHQVEILQGENAKALSITIEEGGNIANSGGLCLACPQ